MVGQSQATTLPRPTARLELGHALFPLHDWVKAGALPLPLHSCSMPPLPWVSPCHRSTLCPLPSARLGWGQATPPPPAGLVQGQAMPLPPAGVGHTCFPSTQSGWGQAMPPSPCHRARLGLGQAPFPGKGGSGVGCPPALLCMARWIPGMLAKSLDWVHQLDLAHGGTRQRPSNPLDKKIENHLSKLLIF